MYGGSGKLNKPEKEPRLLGAERTYPIEFLRRTLAVDRSAQFLRVIENVTMRRESGADELWPYSMSKLTTQIQTAHGVRSKEGDPGTGPTSRSSAIGRHQYTCTDYR